MYMGQVHKKSGLERRDYESSMVGRATPRGDTAAFRIPGIRGCLGIPSISSHADPLNSCGCRSPLTACTGNLRLGPKRKLNQSRLRSSGSENSGTSPNRSGHFFLEKNRPSQVYSAP
ncbi:uncharacterized [Tachysurus ichikawai]